MMAILGNGDIAPAIPVNDYPPYQDPCALRLEAAVEATVGLDNRLLIVYFLA